MEFYTVSCAAVFSLALFAQLVQRSSHESSKEFAAFQRTFFLPYLLMTGGDWLQGPYFYAVYEEHGLEPQQIAHLFVVGFASGMGFGTIVGALADSLGRKKSCILFAFLYAISCATLHVQDFQVLVVGRVLGGISTSLLYSVFDAWMLRAHEKAKFPSEWVARTFSNFYFMNGIVAIVAGLVANAAVDYSGAATAPFDLAAAVLTVGGVIIAATWEENYGGSHGATKSAPVWRAFVDPRVVCVGLAGAAYEASMYTFVFKWVPALTKAAPNEDLPFGIIFSTFMACTMLGSAIFGVLPCSVATAAPLVCVASGAALYVPSFAEHPRVLLASYAAFEVALGVYFPTMGVLRSKVIPDFARATVMNVFRIPLNILVLVALLLIDSTDSKGAFQLCTGLQGAACILFILASVFTPKKSD